MHHASVTDGDKIESYVSSSIKSAFIKVSGVHMKVVNEKLLLIYERSFSWLDVLTYRDGK